MFTAWVKWMVAGNLIGLWPKHCNFDRAWVTQMFTSHQIGYAVEMASVTINVEIWWLRSDLEMITAWVKWMVAGNLIGLWQKHCSFYSMGDTNVYELPNWLCCGNGLCNHQCWNLMVTISWIWVFDATGNKTTEALQKFSKIFTKTAMAKMRQQRPRPIATGFAQPNQHDKQHTFQGWKHQFQGWKHQFQGWPQTWRCTAPRQ